MMHLIGYLLTGLSKVQGNQEKRARCIPNTLRELRTQLTPQFAKSPGGAAGSASRQAGATGGQKGFTIVELIVGVVVGSVIVGGVSLIIANQVHLSQRGRDLVIVNAFVERKVESLRSMGFLGVSNGTTSITAELPQELNPPKSGTLTVSTFSTAVKKVDISVTYNDQGANRTYNYSTFIGELGVGQY